MQFRPYPGAAAQKLHTTWLAFALADIGHAKLRQAVLASARFSDRIIARLANAPSGTASVDPAASVARLAALLRPGFVECVGQFWCAPTIAKEFMAPTGRLNHGIENRDQMRRMLQYRDHAPMDAIGPLPTAPDYASEGEACLAAWLDAQPKDAVAARLRLVFPADIQISEPQLRIALVDRILADPNIEGV